MSGNFRYLIFILPPVPFIAAPDRDRVLMLRLAGIEPVGCYKHCASPKSWQRRRGFELAEPELCGFTGGPIDRSGTPPRQRTSILLWPKALKVLQSLSSCVLLNRLVCFSLFLLFFCSRQSLLPSSWSLRDSKQEDSRPPQAPQKSLSPGPRACHPRCPKHRC